MVRTFPKRCPPLHALSLAFLPLPYDPSWFQAPKLVMLGKMTYKCRQEVAFSLSCCQPHRPWLSLFLSNCSCQSVLEILKMASFPWNQIPKGFVPSSPICSSFQTMSCHNYPQSCLIWPARMHRAGKNSLSGSQKCVQLSRAGGWRGRGSCSGTWVTGSVMVCGCSPRETAWQSWAAESHQPQLSCLLAVRPCRLFKFPVPLFPHLSVEYNNIDSYLVEL